MSFPPFIQSNTSLSLSPAPINPDWIIDGTPVATCSELSRSADGTASTCIWACTQGRFEWLYGRDETMCLLEGELILNEGLPSECRISPGDSVFFPAGSHATWNVIKPVRKIAFVRRTLPNILVLMIKVRRKMKNWRNIKDQEHAFATF